MKIEGLFPMLESENLRQTVEFYTQNLDFETRGFYPDEENLCWVSLRNGDCEIAFGLPNAHTNFQKPIMTGSLYLRVGNVEELWGRLKDKVEIVYPLEDMNYGMREFGIKDCNGYVLNLGQDILEN